MTEVEWLACPDLKLMLAFLRDRVQDCKLRLFACACCRRSWKDRAAEGLTALETAEQYADGLTTRQELLEAHARANTLAEGTFDLKMGRLLIDFGSAAVAAATAPTTETYAAATTALHMGSASTKEQLRAEYHALVALLRDVMGNPFRHVTVAASVLAWNDGTVVKLAQEIYEKRSLPSGELDRTRLAVLADTLEEAGCTDADILAHCRLPGYHVRGCWVVDLITGKTTEKP